MIRVILFDIDGTLIRTGGAGVKAFARVFESEFNLTNATASMQFAGRTDTSLVRECFDRHGIPASPENFKRFFDRYLESLEKLLPECAGEPCPGASHLIDDFQKLTPPPLIGLLTGNVRAGAKLKLDHYNLWDHFAFGAFGDDHEDRDQLACIALERARQMLQSDLNGDEILVVGDTPRDIQCARWIKAKVLAVATGGSTLAELREHLPDWVVADLRQIVACNIIGSA